MDGLAESYFEGKAFARKGTTSHRYRRRITKANRRQDAGATGDVIALVSAPGGAGPAPTKRKSATMERAYGHEARMARPCTKPRRARRAVPLQRSVRLTLRADFELG
jgi:hypothetical protein